MCKESATGVDCPCGQRIAFFEYHLPHCKLAQKRAEDIRLGRLGVAVIGEIVGKVRTEIDSEVDKADGRGTLTGKRVRR